MTRTGLSDTGTCQPFHVRMYGTVRVIIMAFFKEINKVCCLREPLDKDKKALFGKSCKPSNIVK